MSDEMTHLHIDPNVISFVRHLQEAEHIFHSSLTSIALWDALDIQNMFDYSFMIFNDISNPNFSKNLNALFDYSFGDYVDIMRSYDEERGNMFCFYLSAFFFALDIFCRMHTIENMHEKITRVISDTTESKK